MQEFRKVERGDVVEYAYDPLIQNYLIRYPAPAEPNAPTKDACLHEYEEKFGNISYLSDADSMPSFGHFSPAVPQSYQPNSIPLLSELCQIADGKNFAYSFSYGIENDGGFKLNLGAEHSPINIDLLRGEAPKWSLATVPAPILSVELATLLAGPDMKIPPTKTPLRIVTRTLYTLTCPYNPVEVVIDNKKIITSDFPNGPIHSILIELQQPVLKILTSTMGSKKTQDNRPWEHGTAPSLSITVFVNDPSFLAEVQALLPSSKIQNESCSLLPRIIIDSNYLPNGTDVVVLSHCMQNLNAYLTAGTYLNSPEKLPFVPFPFELMYHFNQTLSNYAALIIYPRLKIAPDGVEKHERYTYMTPQDQLLTDWPPYALTYTFNPITDSYFPTSIEGVNGLTPLIRALLTNDMDRANQILSDDPKQIYTRDAWGRTPLQILLLMHCSMLDRRTNIRQIMQVLRNVKKIGLNTVVTISSTISMIQGVDWEPETASRVISHHANAGRPVPLRSELHQAIIARNTTPYHIEKQNYLAHINHIITTSGQLVLPMKINDKFFEITVKRTTIPCVNEPDPWGFYPIMIAAAFGDEEVLRILIKAGANINPAEVYDKCHNEWAYDLLECGVESGNAAVVKILLQHSVNIKSARPFQIAFKKAVIAAEKNSPASEAAQLRIIKLLLRYGAVYGTFLSGLHPVKIAIELANRGKPKLLETILDHTNAFVSTTQHSGLTAKTADTVSKHNTHKASRFFAERINSPRIIGVNLENRGRRIVTKLIDPALKRILEKNGRNIAAANLYANHQLVKDLTPHEMGQMQALFFENFEFNPNVEPKPNAISEIFNSEDNDLFVEFFTVPIPENPNEVEIKSFFIYKISKEEDPALGDFIWFRLLLAASDMKFAGKGLARFLVERIPFMLKNIHPTLRIIVTSISIPPWYGLMVSPNQVYPKNLIDHKLAERLVNRMNMHFVDENLPGVVNENLFVSKTSFKPEKNTDPSFQMAVELTEGQKLPLAVIFEAEKHCHLYSANAHYRGITPEHMARLTNLWQEFTATLAGFPSSKL